MLSPRGTRAHYVSGDETKRKPVVSRCLTDLELGILALSKGAGEDGLGEGDYREEDLGNLHDACRFLGTGKCRGMFITWM
jgi:hypothetical protein